MRKRSDAAKKVITTAARQLFLSQGYVETTIDAIAERAEATKRTIYGYFPDKRALFKGIIEEAVGEPWEFQNLLREVTTISGLRSALLEVAASLDEIITQPDYVQLLRIVITEIPTQPDLGVLLESGVIRRSYNAVAVVLRTASVHGLVTLRDVDAAACRFIGGILVPVFLDDLLQAGPRTHRQSASQFADYVDDFLGCMVPTTENGITG